MAKLVSMREVSHLIVIIRQQRIMLDSDLAKLYGVTTKALNQAVKRNQKRFPEAFMFQLTPMEIESLRSQFVTSKTRGGRRYLPYAFTEHGAIMAANILNSDRAISMSVEVVRAFIRLRQLTLSVEELATKVDALEKKHEGKFKVIFEAVRQLMEPPEPPKRRIGF